MIGLKKGAVLIGLVAAASLAAGPASAHRGITHDTQKHEWVLECKDGTVFRLPDSGPEPGGREAEWYCFDHGGKVVVNEPGIGPAGQALTQPDTSAIAPVVGPVRSGSIRGAAPRRAVVPPVVRPTLSKPAPPQTPVVPN